MELLLWGKENAKVAGQRNKNAPSVLFSHVSSGDRLSLKRDGKKMKVVVGLPQSGEEGV